MASFFRELKRRNVYRVAVAYAVVAWLLIQIATATFPVLEIPNWATKLVIALVVLGFPIALILAWAFELTPAGIQLTRGPAEEPFPKKRRRRGVFWTLVVLGALAGLLLSFQFGRRWQPAAATPSPGAPAKRAVAVLPFENLSEDKANAYFADGMQDEIITRLANIGDLKVISRTSTMAYRAKPEKLSEIARQLGVGHVVEGTVQRIADRVRINVQLIDAATDEHLWAQLYDRNLADVFAVQSEVATNIANSLQAKLSGREQKAMAAKLTDNMAAYDAYLRGLDLHLAAGQNPQDERSAAGAFAEAVRLDPQFAEAWALLSRSSSALFIQKIDKSPARRELARSAAETATRLRPDSPETLLANAYYRYQVQRDYEGARELFEKIRLEVPNSSEAIEALARIARRQSRWKESLRLYEEATRLNPRDPHLYMDRAWTFSMLRDAPATLQMIDRAEAIVPGNEDVLMNKVWFYHGRGDLTAARAIFEKLPLSAKTADTRALHLFFERRYAEAIATLEQKLAGSEPMPPVDTGSSRQLLGLVRSRAGDAAGARKEYLQAKAELERFAQEQPDNIFISSALAQTEAGLGNKEAAVREAARGMAALPASDDPVYAPFAEECRAIIEGMVGEHDRALERIERLLRTPYGAFPLTIAKLRLDPVWDPLRAHPRFQAILAGPEPQTIYN